jgi:hypothetical protein
MFSKCVNNSCSASSRDHDEGKLFRIDINIGSDSSGDECRTEYFWLCSRCALTMNPKIEISGNVLTVRLLAIDNCESVDRAPASPYVPPPVN